MDVDKIDNDEPVVADSKSEPIVIDQKTSSGDLLFPTTPTKLPEPDIPRAKTTLPTKPIIPDLSLIQDSDDEDAYNEQERRDILQAGKLSRFAQSALQYEDVKAAIDNLEKALNLLKPLRQFDHGQ